MPKMKQYDEDSLEFKRTLAVCLMNGGISQLSKLTFKACLDVIKDSGEQATPLDIVEDMAKEGPEQFKVLVQSVLNYSENRVTADEAEEMVLSSLKRSARKALTKFLASKSVAA